MSCRPTSVTRGMRLLAGWQTLSETARPGLSGVDGLMARQRRMGFPSCCQQWQGRRGAQIRGRKSPTVRALEGRHKQKDPPEEPSRSTPRIFPESAELRPLFEATIPELDIDLTVEECLQIANVCRRVFESKMAIKEVALMKDFNVTPYEIHSVALLLLYNSVTTPGGRQYMGLANALLHLAGTVPNQPGGYLPSTLTVVNIVGSELQKPAATEKQKETQRKIGESHFYRSAEKRFLAYMAKDQTASRATTLDDMVLQANAFTQAGAVAERGGDPSRALRWFRAARAVGMEIPVPSEVETSADDTKPRKPKWDWERRCLEAIGRLQATAEESQAEAYEEARAAVRTAALALDSGEACLLLATTYAEGEADEMVQTLLYRAATAAIPGATTTLAERAEAKVKAAAAEGDEKQATEEQLLAKEWRAIAAAAASNEQAAR